MTSSQHLFIESDANPRLKRWRRLALEAKAVRREGATVLEGIHLLQTVLEHPEVKINAVMLPEGRTTAEAKALAERAAQTAGTRLYVLNDRLYDAISPVENGVGVMCEIALPAAPAPEKWAAADALYLDGVQDAGNVGTLIRTAAAAGVRVVVAGPGTAGLWTPRVLRAGMGAHFAVDLAEGISIEKFRADYRGRLLAADARGGVNLFEAPDYTAAGPICWLMGAEGPGLSVKALELADERYWIPISRSVEPSAHSAPLIYFNCSAFKAKGRITVSASGCRQTVFPLAFRPFRSLPGRSGSTEIFSGVSAVHQDPRVKVQDAQLLLCQSHPPRFRPQRRT